MRCLYKLNAIEIKNFKHFCQARSAFSWNKFHLFLNQHFQKRSFSIIPAWHWNLPKSFMVYSNSRNTCSSFCQLSQVIQGKKYTATFLLITSARCGVFKCCSKNLQVLESATLKWQDCIQWIPDSTRSRNHVKELDSRFLWISL